MRKAVLVLSGVAALAGAGFIAVGLRRGEPVPPPQPPAPQLSPDRPTGGPPLDAGRIQSGRLSVERMPEEVTGALEAHSAEIVRTSEALERKQARISGTCAPGSAIRLVGEDGSVVCQRLPRGVVSVSALAGVPRVATTGTAQRSVPGGVGRYQTAGEDDFLVVPISLPDGAVITGFSYVFWDADPQVDGAAYLYRSDDTMMAQVATEDAKAEVRMASTEKVEARRVNNSGFAYMVFMQLSARAGSALMPVAASVSYRLP